MPLLHFHVLEGRTDEEVTELLDAAHEAMLEAFQVPPAIATRSSASTNLRA